jgi:hypothetical protein
MTDCVAKSINKVNIIAMSTKRKPRITNEIKLRFEKECVEYFDLVLNKFPDGFMTRMSETYGSSAFRLCNLFRKNKTIIVPKKERKIKYNRLDINPGRVKLVTKSDIRNAVNQLGQHYANSFCCMTTKYLFWRLGGFLSLRTIQRILHYELHAKIVTFAFSVDGISPLENIAHNCYESEDEWLLDSDMKMILWKGVEFPTESINKSYICFDYDDKAGRGNFTFTPVVVKTDIFCKCSTCQQEKQHLQITKQIQQKEYIQQHKKQQKQQHKLAIKRKLKIIRDDIYIQFITDLGIKQVVCRRRAKYVALMENDNSSADGESSGECRWKYGESRSDMYKAEDELSSTNFSLSTVSVTVSEKSSVHEWEDMEECDDEEREKELNDVLIVLNGLRSQREVSMRNSANGVYLNANWEEEDLLESDCSDDKKERKGERIHIPSSMEVLSADEDGGRAVTGLFKPSDESDTESEYSNV